MKDVLPLPHGSAALLTEGGTIRLGFAHDLEHAGTTLRAFALHGLTSISHRHFAGLFHVALSLALHAIRFNYCCHFLQGFCSWPTGQDC